MDAAVFDRIVRSSVIAVSRRGLVRGFTIAVVGTMLAGGGDVPGKGGKNRRRRRKRCKASRVCAGRCGQVASKGCNLVDCGSCPCPACAACQRCDPATGLCIPDSAAAGTPCGQPGQRCQADGQCTCDATSCGACLTCGAGGVCAPLANGTPCGTRIDADDFLRCCNGVCPAPVCVPSGSVASVLCPNGNEDCAGIPCCSQKTALCSAPCFCLFSDEGEICASDEDCNDPLVHPERRFCICGVCVIP